MTQPSAPIQNTISDLSLWGVLLGNIFSIAMAVFQRWDLTEIMWIFLAQSIVIGFVNFIRILSLKEFSTEGFKINDRPAPPTHGTKIFTAFFFLIHYGGFHAAYALFLSQKTSLMGFSGEELFLMGLCAMGFFSAHGFSFIHNLSRDFKEKKPNIGTLMFYPYLRILPMHITIILGENFVSDQNDTEMQSDLILFMALKTAADAGMHLVEHSIFQQKDRKLRPPPL